MTSQPGQQTIVIHILSKISQYLIFGRLESDFNKKHASRELLSFKNFICAENCGIFTKRKCVKEKLIIFFENISRNCKIVFYALLVYGHCFVQYGFSESAFPIGSFGEQCFVFLCILCFVPALCRIRYNLHKLYNICIINVYIVGVRFSVILLSLIRKNL